MDNPIRFRPHHFLCMLTYIGKGYSEAFIQNYDHLIDRLNTGDCEIILINGPDDMCAPRLCDPTDTECHCRESHITERDAEALADIQKIPEFASVKIGSSLKLTKTLINRLRDVYKTGEIRTACIGCEWKSLCDGIAENNFKGTKLK
jgi:hypothetical protein